MFREGSEFVFGVVVLRPGGVSGAEFVEQGASFVVSGPRHRAVDQGLGEDQRVAGGEGRLHQPRSLFFHGARGCHVLGWTLYIALVASGDAAEASVSGTDIGESMRLDHDYAILARPGAEGGTLHEGNTPYNPACDYHFRNGKFYNGLVVVSFALADVGAGDGGFCCIAGSHKSNVERPPEYGTTASAMEEQGLWLVQPPLAAGDALIFTEALTHGTMPWSGGHERRALFYKYSPGYQSWSNEYRAADEEMDETQRRLMEPPYVYRRQPVVEVAP